MTAPTPGPWEWRVGDDGMGGLTLSLVAPGSWERCDYFCEWPDGAESSRGSKGRTGHEHRCDEAIIAGWGYDASGITICGSKEDTPEREREHPNARLIAAAPDLLDALKALYYRQRPSLDGEPEMVAARAAIAKAEGR